MLLAPYRKRSAGLTLVELMVALAVSLLLAAGILSVLIQSRTSYKFQEALTKARADGSAAIAVLERELRIAGYPADPLNTLSGIADTSTDNNIDIFYEAPSAGHRNCAGAVAAAAGDAMTTAFSLGSASGISGLLCGGQIVSENVTGLTFSYGEDMDGDGVPNGYVPSASVGSFGNVISIAASLTVDVAYDDLPALTFSTIVPLRNQIR